MQGPRYHPTEFNVEALNDEDVYGALSSIARASWRQYPAYGKVAAQVAGAESRYVRVHDGADLVAIANLRIRRLPLFRAGVAMIAQGPAIIDNYEHRRAEVIEAIRSQVAVPEGLSLRVNHPLMTKYGTQTKSYKIVPNSNYETFLLDIQATESELRSGLDGKWRTDLRRGERSDVVVTRSQTSKDFRAFQPLLAEVALSKGFAPPQDADFFADVADKAGSGENLTIHLAWCDGRLVGGHIGAFSGDIAVYLLGAVNAEGRNLRASFILQWDVVKYAQERGLKYYDLGGADRASNPDVFRFKKRMGGEHYVGPSTIEASAGWSQAIMVSTAEWIYKKVTR